MPEGDFGLEISIEHFRRQPPTFPELQQNSSADYSLSEMEAVIQRWFDWIYVPLPLHLTTRIYTGETATGRMPVEVGYTLRESSSLKLGLRQLGSFFNINRSPLAGLADSLRIIEIPSLSGNRPSAFIAHRDWELSAKCACYANWFGGFGLWGGVWMNSE